MAKTKYVKKGSKMADFLCIFVQNLKWIAPSLEWWETLIFFCESLGTCAIIANSP